MDVNHFGSSTALLSKHILQTIYVSIYKISRPTQAQSLAPSPEERGQQNWSNSDIRTLIKTFKVYTWYPKKFPRYRMSRDHFIITSS